jgi:CheY-specific phosphatase CheX
MNCQQSDNSLPEDVTDAFRQATLNAFSELFQLDVMCLDATVTAPGNPTETIVTATINLVRPDPSWLTIRLTESVARGLAQRYLPPGTPLDREVIGDTIGELANVVAGQSKTALKGTPYHFLLSIPTVTWLPGSTLPAKQSNLNILVEFPSGRAEIAISMHA